MERERVNAMQRTQLDNILRHLRRTVRSPDAADTDARLLERFLRHRDEAAFESLVLRHGPLVLGVCRRVLRNEHDAEDAFQATFLVLVRKAASIHKRRTLGPWLYGVAHRTALEARRAMARRRAKEAEAVPRAESSAEAGNDLREVLDRELAALPDRYREVVVLCDLQGKGRREVARELGCPEGTVASRLARGRSLLGKRLARYGLATGAVAAVSQETVSAPLVSATVRTACLSTVPAGAVSARVSFLVERVVRSMLLMRLRTVATVVLLVGVVGSGAGWLCFHPAGAAQPGKGDKLRQEVELLRAELQKALDRVANLEAKLQQRDEGEALFRGKPAAYWVKALKDRDPVYRQEAVDALVGIGKVDRSVIPVLAGALKDEDAGVIGVAARGLAGLGKPALPYLIDALKEPGQRNRAGVFSAIGMVGRDAEPAVPVLVEVLKGSNRDERQQAAQALASVGPGARAAVPALIEVLKGRDAEAQQTAAYTLEQIGPDAKAAVPALIELLKAPDEGAQQKAAQALGGIGPGAKEAVPSLIALLKRPDVTDRWIAAVALGRIGPDAKAAVPALLEVLRNHPGPGRGAGELPQKVTEAIEKIDPETAAKLKQP
jgi:RNA polymerase sigma factor (sigma-70 family)